DQRPAAERGHLRLQRAGSLHVPSVRRHHVPALSGQQEAQRAADTAGASGHQRHPVRHEGLRSRPGERSGVARCNRSALVFVLPIAMGLLHGLWLLVVGSLGAATVVARDRRGARALSELEPYRGWIGVISAVIGAWRLFWVLLELPALRWFNHWLLRAVD